MPFRLCRKTTIKANSLPLEFPQFLNALTTGKKIKNRLVVWKRFWQWQGILISFYRYLEMIGWLFHLNKHREYIEAYVKSHLICWHNGESSRELVVESSCALHVFDDEMCKPCEFTSQKILFFKHEKVNSNIGFQFSPKFTAYKTQAISPPPPRNFKNMFSG